MAEGYRTREVARLARVPENAVRSMVRAGFVRPVRGPRGALLFSFQDLVLVKAASRLMQARISARRIATALRGLRAQLPESASLTGLSIIGEGDRIVVREAGATREASSGQYLLALDVRLDEGKVRFIEMPAAPQADTADDAPGEECEALFRWALALEAVDVAEAIRVYERCVARHGHGGAAANLGRLLHEQGRLEEAVRLYQGIAEPDAVLLYNLAVAQEDLGQPASAMASYERAIALDPLLADAHFNLARLHERSGDTRAALRHWTAYRRLTAG